MSQSYQKLTCFVTIAVLLAVFHLPSSLCGNWVSLDTASDSRGWKIQGNSIYITTGDQLRQFKSQLPSKFIFEKTKNIQGVWIIFPNLDPTPDSQPNATAFYTNTVTFSYSASAQLFETVKLKYNAAGTSTIIKITSPNTQYTITPRVLSDEWPEETIHVGNSNRFTIEATTHEPGDFILIDRIISTFVETTTTSRRPRTSTTTPLPKNEGCRPTQLTALTGIMTVSCFLRNWNLL